MICSANQLNDFYTTVTSNMEVNELLPYEAEAYVELCQISKNEFFSEIINSRKPVTISPKSFILDVVSVLNNARSSRPEMFWKEVVLENFAKFTGKQLCQSSSFNKVGGL